MTNLETMERANEYCIEKYKNAYFGKMSSYELDANSVAYSAQALYKVLYEQDGMCNEYTRNGNLRYDMAALGDDTIKTELLKNVVNCAMNHKIKDDIFGNQIGEVFAPNMSSEQMTVVLFNNMTKYGVERGYELLNDPNILFSACQSFAGYRRPGKKEELDSIAATNQVAVYMNHELDLYYARYGSRRAPMGVDVSELDSYGYDSHGGFSGFGRK